MRRDRDERTAKARFMIHTFPWGNVPCPTPGRIIGLSLPEPTMLYHMKCMSCGTRRLIWKKEL